MNTIKKVTGSILLISFLACGRNSDGPDNKDFVSSLSKEFTLAFNSGDINKLMKYFADDAIVISCGWRMSGRDSIASGMKYMLEHSSELKVYQGLSSVSDDIVFTQDLVTLNWKNETYSALAKGVMILVWKKQNDGTWKITFEEENHGDLPDK